MFHEDSFFMAQYGTKWIVPIWSQSWQLSRECQSCIMIRIVIDDINITNFVFKNSHWWYSYYKSCVDQSESDLITILLDREFFGECCWHRTTIFWGSLKYYYSWVMQYYKIITSIHNTCPWFDKFWKQSKTWLLWFSIHDLHH